MQKNKVMFYTVAALAIVVIIGIIFLKKGDQTPSGVQESKSSPIGAPARTPEKETNPPEISEPTSGDPDASPKQKSDEKDLGIIISGVVTLSNGSPAAEAVIVLSKMEIGESPYKQSPLFSAKADKNGKYSISVRNFPVILVKASYPGYASLTSATGSATSRKSDSSSGKKGEVIINFTLPPASYIKGVVVDEDDKPIEGVSMTVFFVDQQKENISLETASTNNKGRFEFLDVPPGKINISAGSLDYAPLSMDVTAPADDIVLKLLPATASLSGRVFHKITGEAVTSATVSIIFALQSRSFNIPGKTSITDATGFYNFDRLPSGQYFIKAEKDDLVMFKTDNNPHRLELRENEKKDMNLFLYQGHTVKGRVTDKVSGTPIEGVMIRVAWAAEKPVEDITDAQGFYMLRGLSGAEAGLQVEKENYFVQLEERYRLYLRVALDPEQIELTKDIQMTSGLFISGRVETETGDPEPNAQVFLYQLHDPTHRKHPYPLDHAGNFKFIVAPHNSYNIKAEATGFPAAFSDPVNVEDKSIENIVIVLKQGASISGIVQDMEKNPVEGANVTARIPMYFGKMMRYENLLKAVIITDSRGQFKVENLPSGNVNIYAEKDGYAKSGKENISLNSGEEKTGVILELSKASFLAGKITNPEGNPLENVHIDAHSVKNSNGHAQTDAEGNYRIEGLCNAPHNVQLSHQDYGRDFHQNIDVGREDADFVMGANKITLIGNVRDWKTGNPISDFNVSCDEFKPEKHPNAPGRFVIRNLTPNHSFRLKIESEGYLPNDNSSFSLPEGENVVERFFDLGHGGGIRGRVINKATREPMGEVAAHLFIFSSVNTFDIAYSGGEWHVTRGEPTRISTTGEDGVFDFEAVPAESCFIRFIPPEPLKPKQGNITVKHGEITDMGEVEMSGGGNIKGKLVQMPDEIPVPGKTITLRSFGWQMPEQNDVTDEQGRFEFPNLMSGEYVIEAKEYNISKFAKVKDDETSELELRIGTGSLKGVVLRKGAPQQSVNVNLYPIPPGGLRTSYTDSKGEFEITNLVPGKWKVDLQAGYYIPNPIEEVIDIAADAITEKVFELPSGRIVGRVVNTKEEPVDGALISARLMQGNEELQAYSPWTSLSDKDGAFVITDLFTGSYTVSASKKDVGLAFVENVFVPENADSEPVLLKIDAGKGGTLVSLALNLTNGEPVPKAWCHLTTSEGVRFDHGRTRNQDGVITITNIPEGTYMVQVSWWGFSSHEHIVEIKEGGRVELEDVMYEAGALRWTVLDEEGNPVSHASCRIEPVDENPIEKPREGKTDALGLWTERGLYPGKYRVNTILDDGRGATDVIEIQAHQFTDKTAVVKRFSEQGSGIRDQR